MAVAVASPPEQGQPVSARSRQWIVNDVRASTLPPPALKPTFHGPQHLLTLSSVEDDGLGEELQVIWEIEPGARVIEKVALPEPTGFDPPDKLDAFLDAVRWGAASTADVKNIQAPFRSGIDIEDYQLDPVVRAIQMPRVNLLIADDVGLGKTIEAGMTALELIIRHRARRILVVCPSALQIQWKEQMRDKFGLDFRIVDSNLMKELRRSRGIHVNPWSHFPRLITSIDFLKRERSLRLFREILPGPDEATYPRKFDLLILDEAHNCAPSGRGKYATDSLRTQALRVLAPHFEHKLFLTATPHNGYPESFTALLELLDTQRFARGTPPDRKQLEAVMVRRLKSELPPKWDGSPRFPKRILEPLEVAYTEEERAIHAALRRYSELRQARAEDNAEKFATEFVLKTLKKRLFSSPAAFAATLEQHEKSLYTARRTRGESRPSFGILQRELDRIEEDYADDSEYDEATIDAVDTASRLFSEPTEEELTLLKRMKDWAARASAQLDSKVRSLLRWLNDRLRPGKKWGNERVIIFTEYRATQNWLKTVLATEGFTGGDKLLTMYGGMDPHDREPVKAAFQTAPDISPVRILLATDAASEGLDLQNHCSRLIHYEIPWNPNRMEQRNGRIDRHGQKAAQVNVYHFVAQGYKDRERGNFSESISDLEADLEFLMRVARKIETIREDLGKVGPVIAQQVEEAMLSRRSTLNTAQAEKDAEPVRRMLDKKTGEFGWKKEWPIGTAHATPLLVEHHGQKDILVPGQNRLTAFDAKTHAELWCYGEGKGPYNGEIISSPVYSDGMLFLQLWRESKIHAIRLNDKGEPPTTVWVSKKPGPVESSLPYYRGLVYALMDNGVLVCLDGKTGDEQYRERLGAACNSSPIASDGKIFVSDNDGNTFVVKAGRQFEVLATNQLHERITATPAITGNWLIYRTDSHLYCIGEN